MKLSLNVAACVSNTGQKLRHQPHVLWNFSGASTNSWTSRGKVADACEHCNHGNIMNWDCLARCAGTG